MITITGRTNKEHYTIQSPETWDEVTVEQYQRIIKEWDGEDWIQLFSILTGLEATAISESKSGQIESALYQSIQFVFERYDWDALKIPKQLDIRPLWFKDCPLIIDTVKIKPVGRMSIGQNIQARKSLEDVKDIREGLSIITAIFLQPLVDKSKYDHLRAIELEQLILKMSITKIYALAFFLLSRLSNHGSWYTRLLNQVKKLMPIKSVRN